MNDKVKNILKYFEELTQIPRPTRGEEKVALHLVEWAKKNNLEVKRDETGNVFVYVEATKGRESEEAVVIQGHMDIVCEKTPDSKVDPAKDPLKLVYSGDWLKAEGTTLGADNGVAIAVAMQAATDKDLSHPKMELLFTIAEEDGFDGVHGLKAGSLKGKYLLNLDSSTVGVFTIASSATQNASAKLKMSKTSVHQNVECFELILDGCMGGHSGIDIAKKRANAAVALMWTLKEIADKMPLYVGSFNGGTRRNVIPRKAVASIAVESSKVEEMKKVIAECEKYIIDKYTEEKNAFIKTTSIKFDKALSLEDSKKMIDFVCTLPNGVNAWSKKLENTIEGSNNIAIVELLDDGVKITSLQRGATSEGLKDVTGRIEEVAKKFNASEIDIQQNVSAPWSPNPDSVLLKRCQKVFKKLFDKEAMVVATHGGLECAEIGAKHPGMDMISFGAHIEDLHSPDERLFVPSLEPVYNLVCGILEEK